jgi:hypothetical protein
MLLRFACSVICFSDARACRFACILWSAIMLLAVTGRGLRFAYWLLLVVCWR